MKYAFLLYLLSRCDPAHTFFTLVLALSLFTLLLSLAILLVSDGDLNIFTKWPQSRKWFAITAVIGAAGTLLIPTQRDLLFIAGGVGVIEAAKAVQGSEIARNSVLVIEDWLKGQLKKEAK